MIPVAIPFLILLALLASVRARIPVPGGKLVSRQGPRPRRRTWHNGIDLSAPVDTPIYPLFAGTVVHICTPGIDCCGYGNAVLVKHLGDVFSFYGHMDRVDVTVGQSVTKDTPLGTVGGVFGELGRSGCPTKDIVPHLHLEILHAGFPFSPRDFAARYDVLQVLAAAGLKVGSNAQLEEAEPFDYEEPALVASREKADEMQSYTPEIAGPALRYGKWYTVGLPVGIAFGIAGLSVLGVWLARRRLP